MIRSLFLTLTLAFSVSVATAAETVSASNENCYRDVCVGDRAINVGRDNREVTVIAIDNFGKFVVRFEDNGGVGGNWDRDDLALMRGCVGDLCVGYPALNVARQYRSVKVYAIQSNNRFVVRFDDNGGVGGGWDRWDLAVAWGCVGNLCVNDTVYNRSNSRQAVVAAIQTNQAGVQDRMVLNYGISGLGGNWEVNDLALIQRGPTAYPPAPPMPAPIPYCPPGTHYDPRIDRCVANIPTPPPARVWQCSILRPGRVFTGRGPTQSAALQGALLSCAQAGGGYVCRASEAMCSIY